MRIWLKLTSVLSVLLLVVVVTMIFAVQWSFDRGFLQYVSRTEATMSRLLADTIEDAYAVQGSWAFLRSDRRALLQLFNNWSWRAGRQERRERQRELLREARDAFERGMPSEFLQIAGRVLIVDADGRPVAGRTAVLDAQASEYPLEVDGKRIGMLLVGKPERLTREIDLAFKEEQRKSLYLIGVLLVSVTLLVSWLAARMIAAPIRSIVKQGRRLASGDYQVRSEVNRSDELGALAAHLDSLGRTLENNEQARRRWIADISHELRTPLTVLRGEVEALRDGVRKPDDEALESLAAETSHLGKLVNDLYELSLSDLGALDYRKQLLEPGDLLDTIAARMKPRFEARGLELATDIVDLEAEGEFDSDRLTQLFTNLMENSLRYTDAPGKVRVSGRCNEAGDYEITIEDSAPGVARHEREFLFERLYRVESSRNRAHGGAGLGLAIVRNIVLAHDGQISLDASPLGGLKISIALPLDGEPDE